MKTLRLFFIAALVATLGIFTGCEEEEATITITESSVPDSVGVGESVTLQFSIIADEKLETIELRLGTSDLDTKEDGFTSNTSDNYSYTGVLADTADAGTTLELRLVVTDKKDNEEIYDFEIVVKEIEVVGDPINTYNDKILGSYAAAEGSSFASVDGTVYGFADATTNSGKVDFVYFYGAANAATLAAPDDANAGTVFDFSGWATKNSTKFGTTDLSPTEFDAIDDDVEILEEAASLTDTKVNQLVVDDVIAFETASTSAHPSKKGLILVTDVVTGSDGTIEITVKVQQ